MDKALADELIRRILISLRSRTPNGARKAKLAAMKRLRYSWAPFQFRG
jgi:hypothetical protein